MFSKRIHSVSSDPTSSTQPAPGAFVLCPLGCLPAGAPAQMASQQAIYQWAFEQAQQVVRPSLPERDLLAVWN
jgi:hypothetical protein